MPTNDSPGAGLARGLQFGLNLKLQKDRDEADRALKEAERLSATMMRTREASIKSFEQWQEIGASLAASGVADDDPRMQSAVGGAFASLMGYATVAQQMHEAGASSPNAQVFTDRFEDPKDFVGSHLTLMQAATQAARAEAESEPVDTSDFFAIVAGFGADPVRVTKEDTTEGAVFRVDDQVVSAADVSQPVQKRQEVTELQIPGRTAADTSKTIGELQQQIAASNSYAVIANQLARDVSTADGAAKIGTVADVISAFGELTAQVGATAEIFGLDSPFEDDQGNPISRDEALDQYDFGTLTGATAEVRRTLLDMVFLDLAAKGQTGRAVSDRDLEIFMRDTGIKSQDPVQVIAGISRGVENNQIQIKEGVTARSGGGFTIDDIAPGGLVDFQSPVAGNDAVAAMTAAFESGDLDLAEKIADALLANDIEALNKLLENAEK